MAPISGWYDDPRDASRLRYWDGDAWTEHVTAKQQRSRLRYAGLPGAVRPSADLARCHSAAVPRRTAATQQQDWQYETRAWQQQQPQPQQWQQPGRTSSSLRGSASLAQGPA